MEHERAEPICQPFVDYLLSEPCVTCFDDSEMEGSSTTADVTSTDTVFEIAVHAQRIGTSSGATKQTVHFAPFFRPAAPYSASQCALPIAVK
jgi:hypothetical protein